VKNGVVVDFYHMNKVIKIDPNAQTVSAQAGVVWERLDRELAKQGLTLRLYPSSYPSSTVGGWLAQGGAGIGSYEAGWFRDNVVSARVVLPSGEVREFSGKELDLISEAEGITGYFIDEVTVRIMPLDELEIIAIGSEMLTPDHLDTNSLYVTQKLNEAGIDGIYFFSQFINRHIFCSIKKSVSGKLYRNR
jgi:FAD/FMN-containing dehydrogenase